MAMSVPSAASVLPDSTKVVSLVMKSEVLVPVSSLMVRLLMTLPVFGSVTAAGEPGFCVVLLSITSG